MLVGEPESGSLATTVALSVCWVRLSVGFVCLVLDRRRPPFVWRWRRWRRWPLLIGAVTSTSRTHVYLITHWGRRERAAKRTVCNETITLTPRTQWRHPSGDTRQQVRWSLVHYNPATASDNKGLVCLLAPGPSGCVGVNCVSSELMTATANRVRLQSAGTAQSQAPSRLMVFNLAAAHSC